MPGFDYAGPATVEEAVTILDETGEDATILAGGQSLIILLQQRLVRPAVVVGLRRIGELDGVQVAGERLVLGAMTTYSTVSASSIVRERAGILCRAAGAVGSVHIRNRGTVGGSVCHADPAGDVPTVLLALGANLAATAYGGTRHAYPVDTFFAGFFQTVLPPGELLLSIEVDAQPRAATHGYRRFCFREGEYPMCEAAVRLLWDDERCVSASVAMGGAADRPQRLAVAERALTGFALPDARH